MESLLKANQKQGLDTITELASRIEFRLTAIQHELENLKNITEDAIICEGLKGHIQCSPGQKISVYNANYGRTNNGTICPPGPTSNPNCRAADSYTSIYNACNNKQRCDLAANNRVYGDPCPGTYKYIEVKFACLWE
ncbi:D-galactoside-specific lectin-like [Mya arenaria]|uniref:D-galactoside-specific lectin-like n=1 Tax=Mya arenaria TaxID=6604 RepID=UPI0022E81865|nr:D-galactoside-specific lectin-like [Mya arenaria]